jgi:hypothetical protein
MGGVYEDCLVAEEATLQLRQSSSDHTGLRRQPERGQRASISFCPTHSRPTRAEINWNVA